MEENSLCYSQSFTKDVERLEMLLLLLRIQESFLIISLEKSNSLKTRSATKALPLPPLQYPQKYALPHTSGDVSHFSSLLLSGERGVLQVTPKKITACCRKGIGALSIKAENIWAGYQQEPNWLGQKFFAKICSYSQATSEKYRNVEHGHCSLFLYKCREIIKLNIITSSPIMTKCTHYRILFCIKIMYLFENKAWGFFLKK